MGEKRTGGRRKKDKSSKVRSGTANRDTDRHG